MTDASLQITDDMAKEIRQTVYDVVTDILFRFYDNNK